MALVDFMTEPDKAQSWERRKEAVVAEARRRDPAEAALVIADKGYNLRDMLRAAATSQASVDSTNRQENLVAGVEARGNLGAGESDLSDRDLAVTRLATRRVENPNPVPGTVAAKRIEKHDNAGSKGGSDRHWNRVAACRACNRSKDDTPLETWLAGDTPSGNDINAVATDSTPRTGWPTPAPPATSICRTGAPATPTPASGPEGRIGQGGGSAKEDPSCADASRKGEARKRSPRSTRGCCSPTQPRCPKARSSGPASPSPWCTALARRRSRRPAGPHHVVDARRPPAVARARRERDIEADLPRRNAQAPRHRALRRLDRVAHDGGPAPPLLGPAAGRERACEYRRAHLGRTGRDHRQVRAGDRGRGALDGEGPPPPAALRRRRRGERLARPRDAARGHRGDPRRGKRPRARRHPRARRRSARMRRGDIDTQNERTDDADPEPR